MLTLRNTTNIPDKLIHIAIAQGIQEGVELDTIIVKNKRRGKVAGQWGWYYDRHPDYGRCVVIIVPRVINNNIRIVRKNGIVFNIRDRSEFLIKVMAHELRHAYQYQVLGWNRERQGKRKLEEDCHNWEYVVLCAWRKLVSGVNMSMAMADKG